MLRGQVVSVPSEITHPSPRRLGLRRDASAGPLGPEPRALHKGVKIFSASGSACRVPEAQGTCGTRSQAP